MNKPAIVALAVLGVFFSATAASVPAVYAQYGSQQTGVTEEQLAECEELGIERAQCTDNNILAKRRLIYAQETTYGNNPEGSGTAYFAGAETWVFIGVLAAIFGGVAAAFFFKGRGATPPS